MMKCIEKRHLGEKKVKVAMRAIADNYVQKYAEERRRADEDEDEINTAAAFDEACIIKSSDLSGANKQSFEAEFGSDLIRFAFGVNGASADIDRNLDGELIKVNIRENGTTTSISASEINTAIKTAERKMVCVSIDTGKGGKRKFWVDKSNAN